MTVFTPSRISSPPAAAPPRDGPRDGPRNGARGEMRDGPGRRRRGGYWTAWTMLTLFVFIAFECTLLAAALKGSWFILMAPGFVCAVKAWDAWKVLQRESLNL